MRTKLFVAFLAVILMALLSNLIFHYKIIDDFEEYSRSVVEDELYLVLAAVEGCRKEDGTWDREELVDSVRWAAMLGFGVEVLDEGGHVMLTTRDSLQDITPALWRRVNAIVELNSPAGEFEDYPLFSGGVEIGTLKIRPLRKHGLQAKKEDTFKRRENEFQNFSFLIAGGGAVFLALMLVAYITRPLRRLREAASRVASGDFSVRIRPPSSGDEIEELGKSFDHMVESLEREEAIRKRLTSNIAHELRTPLTVMRAQIEAISDGVIEPDRETIDTLSGEVHRLVRLVEGIEEITRAEASIFKQPSVDSVNLRGMLEGIAQSLGLIFERKGLSLELAGPALVVRTDADKLEIILRNLLNNAAQHTAAGGVSVSWGAESGGFSIEVRDTGPGIPAEEIPLLFKRFYKGSASSGTGVGLSIVRELLDILGGTVTVMSKPGEGAVFRVSIPEAGSRRR